MSFMDVSIRFQVKASDENPGAASHLAPEEGPNYPHSEPLRVVLYSRPSEVITGKQAGMVRDIPRKAFESIERHLPEEWEIGKKQFRRLAIPDMQADDLEHIGILVGEVFDEKIIQEGCSVRVPIIV